MGAEQRQFEAGLRTIRTAIDAALTELGLRQAAISYTTRGSTPSEATFTVTIRGQTEVGLFSREQIEDSANSIDPVANIGVGALARKFVSSKT